MSDSHPENAPAWPVVQVRNVRAETAGQAVDVAEDDLRTASGVDTGEPGHVAGGKVYGVTGVPNDEGWDGLTVNQGLAEVAVTLLEISALEGDDGTGGYQTRRDLESAISYLTDLKEEHFN